MVWHHMFLLYVLGDGIRLVRQQTPADTFTDSLNHSVSIERITICFSRQEKADGFSDDHSFQRMPGQPA